MCSVITNQSNYALKRFSLSILRSVDVGVLADNGPATTKCQQLRIKDSLFDALAKCFCEREIADFYFNTPFCEDEILQDRAKAAQRNEGKGVWTNLFYQRHSPLLAKEKQGVPLNTETEVVSGGLINVVVGPNAACDFGVVYKGCTLRITRNGVLSMRFLFEKFNQDVLTSIEEYINLMTYLKEQTIKGFSCRMRNIIKTLSHPKKRHPFEKHCFRIGNTKDILDSVENESTLHYCLFLEGLSDIGVGVKAHQDIPVSKVRDTPFLLGILNRSAWWEKYSTSYIKQAFGKNVGYREDEIYITDKDSTLIMLKDYWDLTNSLSLHYKDNLTLAIELQVANVARVRFIEEHMQSDEATREALANPQSPASLRLVKEVRSVMSHVSDAVDTYALISHGFTRRVVEQVSEERRLNEYIGAIEKRINSLDRTISLQYTSDIQEKGLRLSQDALGFSRKQVLIAIIALGASALLSALGVLIDLFDLKF